MGRGGRAIEADLDRPEIERCKTLDQLVINELAVGLDFQAHARFADEFGDL